MNCSVRLEARLEAVGDDSSHVRLRIGLYIAIVGLTIRSITAEKIAGCAICVVVESKVDIVGLRIGLVDVKARPNCVERVDGKDCPTTRAVDPEYVFAQELLASVDIDCWLAVDVRTSLGPLFCVRLTDMKLISALISPNTDAVLPINN